MAGFVKPALVLLPLLGTKDLLLINLEALVSIPLMKLLFLLVLLDTNNPYLVNKCFFSSHSFYFEDVLELKTHLLSSPKSTLYTSPVYISKFIGVIDYYPKPTLLASLQEKYFIFITDETNNITSIEKMAVHATFDHNNEINVFNGIYLIRKFVRASLSPPNIMKSLEQYFPDQSIDMSKVRIACMDTTNLNYGDSGRLERLPRHTILHLNWVGCGNHKLVLCFKQLLQEFLSEQESDAFLKTLWKFFKYCSLAMNLLGKSMYCNYQRILSICICLGYLAF